MLSRAAVGSLLICLSVVPCAAQIRMGEGENPAQGMPTSAATYAIGGAVRDAQTRQGLAGVRVLLERANAGTLITSTTDGNGEFKFSNIPRGDYIVEIQEKGYLPAWEQVSVGNNARYGVVLTAQRTTNREEDAARATVSAHELGVPRKARKAFQKGVALVDNKRDFQGGLEQFQRAIRECPTYYEAYALMGIAYVPLGDLLAAENALRKSIELAGGHYPDAYFVLSELLNKEKRFGEAETAARQGIALKDSSWQGQFQLARALVGLNRMAEAEKSATEARDLNPDNPKVFLLLANIHLQRRDTVSLIQDLDGYLNLNPEGREAVRARTMRDQLQRTMLQKPDGAAAKP